MMSWFSWNKASKKKLEEAENIILESASRDSISHGPPVELVAEDIATSEDGEVFHVIRARRAKHTESNEASLDDVQLSTRPEKVPIVIWHGFASGSAVFANNLVGLCQLYDGEVIAIDLLGCGLSSRPKWRATNHVEAKEWFLGSFQRLRHALELDKFVLVGHSLGGYLAANYALQYPESIHHLVLASPVGIPNQPEVSLEEQIEASVARGDLSPRRAMFFKLSLWMWNKGTTPQGLVRWAGPWGRSIVSGFINRRFNKVTSIGLIGLPPQDETAIDYFYHNAALPASGDKALNHLLVPGAWAKDPLEPKLGELGERVKLSFLYGESDWMDPAPVIQQEDKLKLHSLDIVPNAGHHLYVDNWKHFNQTIFDVVFGVRRG